MIASFEALQRYLSDLRILLSGASEQLTVGFYARARELGTHPLFKVAPTSVLEGEYSSGVLVTLPLACPQQADAVEQRKSWQRLITLTEDSPDRRAMVFAADPDYAKPSPVVPGCTRDAWLGFKGLVSDRDRYFAFLRQIGQSKILDR